MRSLEISMERHDIFGILRKLILLSEYNVLFSFKFVNAWWMNTACIDSKYIWTL